MTETKWTPGPWHWDSDPVKKAEADARLIAAAPSLYEALRQARGMLSACALDEPDPELEASWGKQLHTIDAVLAKARGEQP